MSHGWYRWVKCQARYHCCYCNCPCSKLKVKQSMWNGWVNIASGICVVIYLLCGVGIRRAHGWLQVQGMPVVIRLTTTKMVIMATVINRRMLKRTWRMVCSFKLIIERGTTMQAKRKREPFLQDASLGNVCIKKSVLLHWRTLAKSKGRFTAQDAAATVEHPSRYIKQVADITIT